MAGLLDFLSTDDAQLGLGLLAAAGPSPVPMSVGQRIAAGVGQAQAAKDGRLRNKLLESQIAENTSQDAARRAQLERQQRQDAYYMGGGMPGAGVAPAGGAGAAPAMAGAPAEAGAALKAAAGAPPDAPPPPQGKFAEWSKQYNIPVDALVADYFSNGGKGIADMLFKAGRPNMQVQNGYAYDQNRVQPGFLPSLNTSQDGKSTLTLIDPATGLPRVMPTPGAVDSFGAFQEAGNRSAANYQPERVLSPDGQMIVRPRSEVLQPRPSTHVLPGRPLGAAPGMTGAAGPTNAAERGMAAEIAQVQVDPAREAAQVREMLATPGAIRDPGDRAQATAYLQRLEAQLAPAAGVPLIGPGAGVSAGAGRGSMGTPGTPAVSAGNVVELSPAQQAQNEANRVRLVDTAKADVTRDSDVAKKAKSASAMIAAADRAIELLKQSPTGSGLGEYIDRGAAFFGKSTPGAQVAAQLDIVSGDLVNNVPRMEGPQSDGDRLEYKTQAGRAADRTLPTDQRIAAMGEVKRLQSKYAALNGGPAESSNQPERKAQRFDAPPPAAQYKGRRIKGEDGRILQSDGMTWKAVN